MKSLLLCFLFIIILSIAASAQLLNPTTKTSLALLNNKNEFSMPNSPNIHLKQAQRIIAHPNGTILYEGNYGRSSWSFEIGSSLSSMYQAVPDANNVEHPLDGAVAPYLPGSVIIDIGDGFVQTNDFKKLNTAKSSPLSRFSRQIWENRRNCLVKYLQRQSMMKP
ncbi:non-specific serine/threonine protein kinase [Ranunculus cassubicifolius]